MDSLHSLRFVDGNELSLLLSFALQNIEALTLKFFEVARVASLIAAIEPKQSAELQMKSRVKNGGIGSTNLDLSQTLVRPSSDP